LVLKHIKKKTKGIGRKIKNKRQKKSAAANLGLAQAGVHLVDTLRVTASFALVRASPMPPPAPSPCTWCDLNRVL